jgi:hypothetical protein
MGVLMLQTNREEIADYPLPIHPLPGSVDDDRVQRVAVDDCGSQPLSTTRP